MCFVSIADLLFAEQALGKVDASIRYALSRSITYQMCECRLFRDTTVPTVQGLPGWQPPVVQ